MGQIKGLDHEDWAGSTLPDTSYGNVLSLDESPVNIGDALNRGRVDNDEVQENTIPVNRAPSKEQSKVDMPPETNTKVAGTSTEVEKKHPYLSNKMRLMDTRQENYETVKVYLPDYMDWLTSVIPQRNVPMWMEHRTYCTWSISERLTR